MTNLYFIRHAHSTYTQDELNRPLSEEGFAAASKVSDLFKTEEIDFVVSSPYKRAIQTVDGIAEYFKKEIEIIVGFKERTLMTETTKDFPLSITKVWEDYSFSWDGGESNIMAQKRGVETTYSLLKRYKNKSIVIGTHGNIMVLIMNYFDKQYDFSFWQNLTMPDIYKLTFDGKLLKNVERLWGRL